jgi:2-C-methyl-D-erythritol 4-phosphate cytidylyltransferase
MSITAIIPAAGKGYRMKGEVPKQFLLLAGKPVLIHTLQKLARSSVDALVVVVSEERMAFTRNLLGEEKIEKPFKVLAGGLERQDSVRAGLNALDNDCSLVLIHDAVRPFVRQDMVEAVIKAAEKAGAATLAIRPADTIKLSPTLQSYGDGARNGQDKVMKNLPREHLWQIQTPQAFHKDLIIQAHKKALAEGYLATDDSELVERMDHEVVIIEGDPLNLKITGPEDMIIADAILRGAG